MKPVPALFFLSFLALAACAGWNDLSYSSSENLNAVHQGRNVSLSLKVSNDGTSDGYGVYVIKVTLAPGPCINGGRNASIAGAVICPRNDAGCRNSYPTAGTSAVFNFTGIPTNASCPNGLEAYSFFLEGSEGRTANASYAINLAGPDVCGDRFCAEGWETCASCAQDCGQCRECNGTARTCRNGSIYSCSNGFYTSLYAACPHGCEMNGTVPACTRICNESATRCAGDDDVETCLDNGWVRSACARGCVDGACRSDLCFNVSCPDMCEGNVSYAYGSCDPGSGECTYFDVNSCPSGCSGTGCLEPGPDGGDETPPPAAPSSPCLGLVLAGFAALALCAKAGG
ncbi:MAG: hypothetical protein PHF51_00505 [Candidatus ainarchaeum sp.]|nr:hypothetical protein [Candidatus ainarchaeum sp.]